MKRLTSILITTMLIGMNVAININTAFGQQPPPPPPPNGGPNNGHGLGGNQGPANAPITGGIEIFLALAALYAGNKVRNTFKQDSN